MYLRARQYPNYVSPEEAAEPPLRVSEFMDSEAPPITQRSNLLPVAQLFLTTNYRRLPVLRDGKLVGQISRRDLLRAAHDLLAVPREHDSSLLYLSSLMDRRDAPIGLSARSQNLS